VRRLLVAACVVPSSPIFVTLMKEAPGFSETSVLTRATRRNNPEDTILQHLIKFDSNEASLSRQKKVPMSLTKNPFGCCLACSVSVCVMLYGGKCVVVGSRVWDVQ
jgi:hypothetical protein